MAEGRTDIAVLRRTRRRRLSYHSIGFLSRPFGLQLIYYVCMEDRESRIVDLKRSIDLLALEQRRLIWLVSMEKPGKENGAWKERLATVDGELHRESEELFAIVNEL